MYFRIGEAVKEKLYVTVISHIAHMKHTKWTAQAFWIILPKKHFLKERENPLQWPKKEKEKRKKETREQSQE